MGWNFQQHWKQPDGASDGYTSTLYYFNLLRHFLSIAFYRQAGEWGEVPGVVTQVGKLPKLLAGRTVLSLLSVFHFLF